MSDNQTTFALVLGWVILSGFFAGLLLLSGCASYEVHCTAAGDKSVEIRSARAITGVAAQITPDCGITAAVGTASGAEGIVEKIGGVVQ